MPIYEYKCEHGHVFDTMQKMSDDPLTECMECGASVRKLMQPVGISFKGSGFYSTDYSNGKAGSAVSSAPSESSSNGDSSGSSDGSSSDSSNGSSSDKSSGESSKSSSASEGSSKND